MPRKSPPDANDYISGGNVFKPAGYPLEHFEGVRRISVRGTLCDGGPFYTPEDQVVFTEWTPNRPEMYREFLTPCGNSTCRGGGFRIHDTVQEMVKNRETQRRIDSLTCGGKEKLGRAYRECFHRAGPIDFHVEYEPAALDEVPTEGA